MGRALRPGNADRLGPLKAPGTCLLLETERILNPDGQRVSNKSVVLLRGLLHRVSQPLGQPDDERGVGHVLGRGQPAERFADNPLGGHGCSKQFRRYGRDLHLLFGE